MWSLIFVCAAVAAILVYYMNSKSRTTQQAYLAQRAAISALADDVASKRAIVAISSWSKELNQPDAKLQTPSLGALTAEFIATYAEIVSPNGAHRLGSKHLAPSQYRPEMLTIGKSDYLEVCVLPSVDTVYVIDGSEADDDLTDQYPSIFHLLVDYGELPSSQEH